MVYFKWRASRNTVGRGGLEGVNFWNWQDLEQRIESKLSILIAYFIFQISDYKGIRFGELRKSRHVTISDQMCGFWLRSCPATLYNGIM